MASKKDIVYVILVMYVACTAIAVFLEPFATDLPCDNDDEDDAGRGVGGVAADALRPALKFPNALFVYRPCRYAERYPLLMGLTRRECRFGRHMVVSALLGGIIGYERRSADRPAGIRTMSVVSLSACLFTINSTFVFMSGPMHWDPGERYCKKKGASCARTHSHIDEYNMSQLTATIVVYVVVTIRRLFLLLFLLLFETTGTMGTKNALKPLSEGIRGRTVRRGLPRRGTDGAGRPQGRGHRTLDAHDTRHRHRRVGVAIGGGRRGVRGRTVLRGDVHVHAAHGAIAFRTEVGDRRRATSYVVDESGRRCVGIARDLDDSSRTAARRMRIRQIARNGEESIAEFRLGDAGPWSFIFTKKCRMGRPITALTGDAAPCSWHSPLPSLA
jgi:hypothetical protein